MEAHHGMILGQRLQAVACCRCRVSQTLRPPGSYRKAFRSNPVMFVGSIIGLKAQSSVSKCAFCADCKSPCEACSGRRLLITCDGRDPSLVRSHVKSISHEPTEGLRGTSAGKRAAALKSRSVRPSCFVRLFCSSQEGWVSAAALAAWLRTWCMDLDHLRHGAASAMNLSTKDGTILWRRTSCEKTSLGSTLIVRPGRVVACHAWKCLFTLV